MHCTIGRANFEVSALKENLQALIADLQKAKPAASKGIYLKKHHGLLDHGSGHHGGSVDAQLIAGFKERRQEFFKFGAGRRTDGGRWSSSKTAGGLIGALNGRLRRWWNRRV